MGKEEWCSQSMESERPATHVSNETRAFITLYIKQLILIVMANLNCLLD